MNLRGDRVNGIGILGVNARTQHFLISFYEDAQEYERAFVLFTTDPECFDEFKLLEPHRNTMMCSTVDYFTTLELSRKFQLMKHPKMVEMLENNRRTRLNMYNKFYPIDSFRATDKSYWERLSKHFAKKSGKQINYPW